MIEVPYWAFYFCTHSLAVVFGAVLISTIAAYANKKREEGDGADVHSNHRDS